MDLFAAHYYNGFPQFGQKVASDSTGEPQLVQNLVAESVGTPGVAEDACAAGIGPFFFLFHHM